MLPQLRELEERFESKLVVIGIHSGKYHAERITERIRDASLRLGAEHPVVNDRQFRIWRSYAVSAWPTLVVVDPGGYVVGTRAGEFTAKLLEPFITTLVAAAESKGILNREKRPATPDSPNKPPGQLRYPGKVAVSGKFIAIADSGNHRIIVGTLSADGSSASARHVVGTGSRGFDDGANPSFDSPQGLVFGDDVLYVADSGNHAVRSIDLRSWQVQTIAGTGRQLRTRADLAAGAMSSPWDLTLVEKKMFIAMAGVHQIWTLDIESRRLRVHAGAGGEDIRDGPNPEALLAQPMGISSHDNRVYFADAESSAIRQTDVREDGETRTVVGTGLFDFGDKDGTGDAVRMQHQQGLAFAEDGQLIVADSYNDAIKLVDPVSRTVESWVRNLNEPGGVARGATQVYVADTNAHRIMVVDSKTGNAKELMLQ